MRRWWWRWSERWPLYSVVLFVQALPLLALWGGAAFALVALMGVLGVAPPGTAGLIALLVALTGFGIQQWKYMEEEFLRRRRAVEEALKEVDKLDHYLQQREYAQALDHYRSLRAKGGRAWQSVRVQDYLEAVWEKAPRELRLFSEIWSAFRHGAPDRLTETPSSSSDEQYQKATGWAYRHLDDSWRQKITKMVDPPGKSPWRRFVPEELVQQIEEREWQSAFRCWPEITFYRQLFPPATSSIERGITYLDLAENPFSASLAEEDRGLFDSFFQPQWWEALREWCWDPLRSAVIVGPRGSGKTATAFYRAKKAFMSRKCFPVYVSFQISGSSGRRVRGAIGTVVERLPFVTSRPVVIQQGVAEVARATAYALCFYLGFKPSGFLDLDSERQAAIAFLLERYVGGETEVYYHLAGWSESGYTGEVLNAIKHKWQGIMPHPSSDIDDGTLAQVVWQACPSGFGGVLILADVRARSVGAAHTGDWEQVVRELLRVFDCYTRAGAAVYLFLPDEHTRRVLRGHSIEPFKLRWRRDDLLGLLERRLSKVDRDSGGGEQILRSWCDPEVFREEMLDISTWLIHGVNTPRELIGRVQQLLAHIGRTQSRLSRAELRQILGAYPER